LSLFNRRGVLASLGSLGFAAEAQAEILPLTLVGRLQQGGFVIGKTLPRARIIVDGEPEGQASQGGCFIVGFDRDAKSSAILEVVTSEARTRKTLKINPTAYDIQRIDGLADNQVNPQGDALLARIAAETRRKSIGFSSRADADDFRTAFKRPLNQFRQSGRFGGQRILNGVPKRPHYGADLAAPKGTPILAPAAGLVSFAETGLHFEGGLTLIDHGQGLITAYLHQSRIDVRRGDRVTQGQVIGAVGMEGRATGPHLCWRMKWHGRNLDPMLMVGAEGV
jgi:murein DD-endopeptidase MepM/ murein hydrolase activator NlpD